MDSLAKPEVRRQMRRLLSQLTPDACAEWSHKALAMLEAHPAFARARTLLLYYSLPHEPDTHAFLDAWSGRKRVLLPVVVGEELELREYAGPDCLAIGRFGIGEPQGPAFIDYGSIDVAIIPGLAFDPMGHRLGRGRGYYDRLLPRLSPHTLRIGLCFPLQVIEQVPTDEHDRRVDLLICGE